MKTWSLDKNYAGLYFAQANNKKEYIQLAKELYAEHDSVKSFSCDVWLEKSHLFDEDVVSWHEFFQTECMTNRKYEEVEMPLPQNYNGKIGNQPNKDEYPLVIMFCVWDTEKSLTWYSIN